MVLYDKDDEKLYRKYRTINTSAKVLTAINIILLSIQIILRIAR